MLRGLGIAAGIFVLFFAVGFGLLQWRTHEPDFLAQKVKDRVSQSVSSAPASTASAAPGATDPEALDAPTSGPPTTGALDKTSGGDASTQLETYRVEARDSLQIWYSAVMAGGLLAAATWLIFAWSRAASQTVHGAGGMRSASPFWWGCLLLLIILGVVSAVYALRARALGELISAGTVNGMVLFCALWAMAAYYLACAFGAPTVLRASVPLATSVVPVKGAPR